MIYEKTSFIKYYAKRFYDSNLFMALLVGLLIAGVYIILLDITA